jgi:hypothetical protein
MPRFVVPVTYTQVKEIRVFARDEQEALEKAVSVVEAWDGVKSAEADEAVAEDMP